MVATPERSSEKCSRAQVHVPQTVCAYVHVWVNVCVCVCVAITHALWEFMSLALIALAAIAITLALVRPSAPKCHDITGY